MTDIKEHKHNLRALDRALRVSAESWWLYALSFKISVFIVGALATFFSFLSQSIPFIVAILTAISELCLWRHSIIRDTWEVLHRELDARDSFGWLLSKAEISDLLAQIPKGLRSKILTAKAEEEYFASVQEYSPKRAIENTQESAWWAKHIARKTGNIYTAIVAFLIAGSFGVLILSIETIRSFDVLSNVGRVVTSAIMLVFSLDLLRTCLAYYKYSRQAAVIEERAERMLCEKTVDEVQAIKLMRDYHLAHAEAPMNPNWVWKLMRDDLNELWKTYRRRQG